MRDYDLAVCGVWGENSTGMVVNNFGKRNASASHYVTPLKIGWSGGPNYPADCVVYMVSHDDIMNGVSADTWASNVRQHLSYIQDGWGGTRGTTGTTWVTWLTRPFPVRPTLTPYSCPWHATPMPLE
ncbi:hypothetical protein AB0M11_35080 [Streptomyces sp. NPDC051987]|uniref:hypothetical protein n=1 Tax=Streptomyces sp. NPDC051987 TaxID=3155808 RepID=UPI0034252806